MKWFRFYAEALNDPKILRLTDRQFRAWALLLCIAADNDGVIKIADLPILLRWSATKSLTATVLVLEERGLFHREEGTLLPHNWQGRQFQSDVSTTRVKRFRNARGNVSETPSDTDTDQRQIRAETEAEAEADHAPPLPRVLERAFGRFITPMEADLLHALEEEHPRSAIEYALREAADADARTMRFVKAVCEEQKRGGYRGKSSRPGGSKSAAGDDSKPVATRVRRLVEPLPAEPRRRLEGAAGDEGLRPVGA